VLKQVDYDYQRMQYNTVVSGCMKMLNALEDFKAMDDAGAEVALIEGFGILLRCLYPATPHLTHALWTELGYASTLGDLLDAAWPKVDPAALVQDEIELMLQINGKLRGSILVPPTPTRPPSRPPPWPAKRFRNRPTAPRPRRWWWCRAGWSTWCSELPTAARPHRTGRASGLRPHGWARPCCWR
jgi:leucyl-tRNA synthetase